MATAIFARRLAPGLRVVLLEGARQPGAKILVSGGSRCNVTNTVVTERDFWGGPSTIVRRVLRAFTVEETVAFFRELGVPLHEEPGGKLFPDSNRSRDVLDGAPSRGDGIRRGAARRPSRARHRSDWPRIRRRPRLTAPSKRGASSLQPADSRCRRAAATAQATRSRSGSAIRSSRPRRARAADDERSVALSRAVVRRVAPAESRSGSMSGSGSGSPAACSGRTSASAVRWR